MSLQSGPISPLRSILLYGFLAIVAVLICWYLLMQARLLITGPEIVLLEEPGVVHTERTVVLRGMAKNISYLSVNGRRIFTDRHGYFNEALVLENGYTITTLEAADRYGRTTTLQRSFVYVPATLVMHSNQQ